MIYIKIANNILNFIKSNKTLLDIKLQDFECVKYNLEIYKVKMRQYHINILKLNDSNCIFYTTRQFNTNTNYTLL